MTTGPSAFARRSNAFCGLEQRLLDRLRRSPLPPCPLLVVGFSGGVDSLALAIALGRLAPRGAVRPLLVHVDHGLRPESSSEQEQAAALAAALPGSLGLPFVGRRLPAELRALHPGVGLEEAARRERYGSLAVEVASRGAAALVLAHQADDQAETVLLHLLRGAGVGGAVGMGEWTARAIPWWPTNDISLECRGDEAIHDGDGWFAWDRGDVAPGGVGHLSRDAVEIPIWRPFLAEPKALLRDYVADAGLEPIVDPSNLDEAFRRNAIRHAVLPELERAAPGAGTALVRYAALAAEEDATLARLAASLARRAATRGGELSVAALAAEPAALVRRAVRAWLRGRAGVVPSLERTDALLRLIEPGEGGRTIDVGGGVRVRRIGDRLAVVPPDEGESG